MRTLAAIVIAGIMAAPLGAADNKIDKTEKSEKYNKGSAAKKLAKAEDVIKAALESPDKGIPKELLERAECVGVFPDVKKGAFVVGGTFGRGVFTCRGSNGQMGPPAFFTMGGGSVGWQFGGQEADLVLLIMNRNGIDHLLKDKFSMGGEASATAGPVGRTAKVGTDLQLGAQILSWSRSQGVFLGASLDGTVIKPYDEWNEKFYGKAVTPKEVLVDQIVSIPDAAKSFVGTVSRKAARG